MKKRRNQDAEFKARVALEAVEGERTVSGAGSPSTTTNALTLPMADSRPP